MNSIIVLPARKTLLKLHRRWFWARREAGKAVIWPPHGSTYLVYKLTRKHLSQRFLLYFAHGVTRKLRDNHQFLWLLEPGK